MIRRVVRIGVRTLLALLTASISMLVVLASIPGQGGLLRIAEYVASSADSRIEIGALDGSLFSAGEIRSLKLHDADGLWLEVKSIRFAWRPLALLSGKLDIDELTAEEVLVERKTVPSKSEAKGGSHLPMLRLALERFEARRIILREPVLGEAIEFSVTAHAQASDAPLNLAADLHVERLDVTGAALSATIGYRPDDGVLRLRLDAEETAGGVIAQLAQIPGLPALKLALNGDGPLDRWRAEWNIEANGQKIVQGDASINRADQGHEVTAKMDGMLAGLTPAPYAALLGGHSEASLRGRWLNGQAIDIHQLFFVNDTLRLTGQGGAQLRTPFVHGDISLNLGRKDEGVIALPFEDGRSIQLRRMTFALHLPKDESSRHIIGNIAIDGLDVREHGKQLIGMNGATASMRAMEAEAVEGFRPMRLDPVVLVANAEGLTSDDPGIAAALGPTVNIEGKATVQENRLTLEKLTASLASGVISLGGTIGGTHFDGVVTADLPDLSLFSALVERDLGGSAEIKSKIAMNLGISDLALGLDAKLKNAMIGSEMADRLLTGETLIAGSIARNGDKVEFDDLTFANPQITMHLDGMAGMEANALRLEALADAAVIDPSLSGELSLTASLDGEGDALRSAITLEPRAMSISGKPLRDALIKFSGEGRFAAHSGQILMQGDFEQHALKGSAMLAIDDAAGMKIEALALSFGSATASGNLRFGGSTGAWGDFKFAIPDLGEFSALSGKNLGGRAEAEINIASWNDAVAVELVGQGGHLAVGPWGIEEAEFSVNIADAMNKPRIAGELNLSHLRHEQQELSTLNVKAIDEGASTVFMIKGDGPDLRFSSSGEIAFEGEHIGIAIQKAQAHMHGIDANLARPANFKLVDGTAQITGLSVGLGGGRIDIDGNAGEALDLRIALAALPMKIADTFAPELAASGTIDGNATISGSAEAPQADYKLSWQNVSVGQSRRANLPPLNGKASGKFSNGILETNANVTGQGLDLHAKGTVALAREGRLQLTIKGNVPLALANAPMASRGIRAEGDLQLNASVQGSFAAPKLAGEVKLRDAKLADPASGVKLHAIAATAKLSGGTLHLENLQAQSEDGGSVSASGTITQILEGRAIADLTLALQGFKIDDRNALKGEVNSNIKLQGDLKAQPAISGEIKIITLEVPIPDQPPRSLNALDLKHVNPPAQLRETLPNNEGKESAPPAFNAALDLSIDAGNRIFVRGRGLTAQLGGNLKIKGTSNMPAASGAFQLERGKLAILGREIDFTRGALQFAGSLDPYLDFAAATQIDNAQITILITGQASDPQFRFTSSPDLPEDEILSRLLFNKSLAKLSAVQIAKLAAEVDKIGGLSRGPGVVDQLRSSLGVDVLDVTADEKGKASVTAGSYLQDNAYVGVQQGSDAESSRVIIDLDLTGNLKARGEVGADGESKLGVGMEWDY